MFLELAPEWSMDLDRGPDWLFIRLRPPSGPAGLAGAAEVPLAEKILQQLQQSFCHRLVLELDAVPLLKSWMVSELVHLHKRIVTQGGTLRLCSVSPASEAVLRACRLLDHFPVFDNRYDAVMGCKPRKPR